MQSNSYSWRLIQGWRAKFDHHMEVLLVFMVSPRTRLREWMAWRATQTPSFVDEGVLSSKVERSTSSTRDN